MRFSCKLQRSGAFALACALVLGLMGQAKAGLVNWEGQDWTESNGSATVDGSGHLTLTATANGNAALHVNRLLPSGSGGSGSFINDNGTPWVQFSYIENGTNGIDFLIDDEVTPGNPRLQAGSLFSLNGIGYTRYGAPAVEEIVFADASAHAAGTLHTIYVGKRADGTIDFRFDGTWYTSTLLKDQFGGSFNFNDIHLRLRNASSGQSATFTDFQYGSNAIAPVPEPSALVSGSLGLLTLAGFAWYRRT